MMLRKTTEDGKIDASKGDASMRPQHDAAENQQATKELPAHPGFNEAAA